MMLSDATFDAGINKWKSAVLGKAAEIRAKYANSSPLAAELLTDVDHWWTVASEFANGASSLSNITDMEIERAKYNALDLLEMRAYLKGLYFGSVVPPDVVANAVNQMTAPIDWLVSIGTPVLQAEANYQDMLKRAADLPSNAIKYLLDQAAKAVGLPTWIVPVIAGTAVIGMGAWVYFTFLAPITKVTRSVGYTNPRRRQRRRMR